MKKRLLEKYWKGETTAEEEKWLQQNINSFEKDTTTEEVSYWNQIKQFSELSMEEEFDITMIEEGVVEKSLVKPSFFSHRLLKIAAAVLLLVAFSLFTFNTMNKEVPGLANENDPEEAYQIAKQALLLISENLNKGADYTYELEKFNELQEKLTSENK